ncbi:hypothetical protein A6767_00955 [Aeromonas veronii]|nr:hypothetical protein A6767_00955 [Aeromonas veronii]
MPDFNLLQLRQHPPIVFMSSQNQMMGAALLQLEWTSTKKGETAKRVTGAVTGNDLTTRVSKELQ